MSTSQANRLLFNFRYRLFYLQGSSLRRNPFIGIACGSKQEKLFEKANVVAISLQILNYLCH
jgi:hypothetical protein